MIPSPSLMIWRHALGRSQRRTATSIATSRATRTVRAMIQRLRGMTASLAVRESRRMLQRVDLGGRAEVLPIPGAEFLERVGVLLRPVVLDGVNGRQGGQPADDRPGQSLLHAQHEARPERVAGPGRVDDLPGLGRRDLELLVVRR